MENWECSICGYIYQQEKGDAQSGVAPGVRFEDVPRDWTCPRCGAVKEKFHKIGERVLARRALQKFYMAEDFVYYIIAVILFVSALAITGITIMHLTKGLTTINILNVVNDILLVVIILEIFSTVLIYLTERRISLTPFLIIGLISSVRRILMVSAMMSVHQEMSDVEFHRSILELIVSGGIVISLVFSYYLLSKVMMSPEKCIGCTGFEKRGPGGN
ncbi:MAG: rubredoxin [Nitrospinae bacterium]|nr:rubredoxin [Nitrospinota bacterium]